MRRSLLSLTLCAVGTALPAQFPTEFQVTLPTVATQKNNFPLAGPSGLRYQQWFSERQWQQNVRKPVRIIGLRFFGAGSGGGAQLDMSVRMAHGPFFPQQNDMDANMRSNVVEVVPRTPPSQPKVLLPAGNPEVLTLDFRTWGREFVWDGESPVVVDIRIWDNGSGPGALPRPYDLQATFLAGFSTYRLYGVGANPESVNRATTFQAGAAVAMGFTFLEGMSIPYGTGCPGEAGFVPQAGTTGGLPLPGNIIFGLTVSNTVGNLPAVMLFGTDNVAFGPEPLPFALELIGGPNCLLWVNPILFLPSMTAGGGPGTGGATFPLPIPNRRILRGQSVYSQWLIVDPFASNGAFSMSQGLRTIFGA